MASLEFVAALPVADRSLSQLERRAAARVSVFQKLSESDDHDSDDDNNDNDKTTITFRMSIGGNLIMPGQSSSVAPASPALSCQRIRMEMSC